MNEDQLQYRIEEKIAYITINREEKRNALSPETLLLFLKHLDAAENDAAVNVVCITGTGTRAFCTGAELGDDVAGKSQEAFKNYAGLLKKITDFPKPTVARVNGFCLAGGMGLMLGCDLVIASDTAKFGTPEVSVGLFPMMIGALIFRNMPRKNAMEMILLGERMDAVLALESGLISRMVPASELDAETRKVLHALAAKSPAGMKIGKQAFTAVADMPLEESLDYLAGKLQEVASTEDAKEGIRAFMEKRQPVFTGK